MHVWDIIYYTTLADIGRRHWPALADIGRHWPRASMQMGPRTVSDRLQFGRDGRESRVHATPWVFNVVGVLWNEFKFVINRRSFPRVVGCCSRGRSEGWVGVGGLACVCACVVCGVWCVVVYMCVCVCGGGGSGVVVVWCICIGGGGAE